MSKRVLFGMRSCKLAVFLGAVQAFALACNSGSSSDGAGGAGATNSGGAGTGGLPASGGLSAGAGTSSMLGGAGGTTNGGAGSGGTISALGGTSAMGGAGGVAGAKPDDGDWVAPQVPKLAARPPMGWNSWNKFNCGVSEKLIESTADQIVSSGLKDAGYEFVNIDDCWQTTRDAGGGIVADPGSFPGGIKGLADYVHGKGLKLGVYSDRGTATCAGRPGSQGYETNDASSYASWGVDYLKYDNCNASLDEGTQYKTMQSALAGSGRDIVFSICAWGFLDFMPTTGQLWRTTQDISANWASILSNMDENAILGAYAHPGAWNDPDMLEVGNGTLTDAENRAHFSLWAMMAAPRILGNDLSAMSDVVKGILSNRDVIAVDQDAWGYQGYRIHADNGLEVWTRPLSGAGERAVLLFNRSDTAANISVSFADTGLSAGSVQVRDLWAGKDLGNVTDKYTALVPSHDVVMLRVSGTEPPAPHGTAYLSDLPLTYAANGWGPVERDTSVGEQAEKDGKPLSVAGTSYTKGLGVHAGSLIRYRLGANCSKFTADVGIDDEVGAGGSVVFEVIVDGVSKFQSATMTGGNHAAISVPVTGARELKLRVTDAGDGNNADHADWANALLTCAN